MKSLFPLAIILGSGFIAQLSAQPIRVNENDQIDLLTHTPLTIYQDQMVIRVRTTSQAQLDAMLAITESVWSEHTGVGPLDIQIKRSNLNAISALGIPHDVLIEDLQAHTNASWNQIVQTERLALNARNPKQAQHGVGPHDDNWFANYKQLNEITEYINNIVTLRPDMASTMVIGQSYEGRDMFAITVSAPDSVENPLTDRPIIFTFSTVHAREWIAPMTTVYFASKFIEDYDTDPRIREILDSARIIIVPIGNPDGYVYAWTDYRYWRKNRRANTDGSFGVDINRNWGYQWGGQGASNIPSNDTYRGTAAFSEPETQVLRDTALSFGDQLIAHMEYHSYSQLVMWPFGYGRRVGLPVEPDRTYFDLVSNEVAMKIDSVHGAHYIDQQSVDLYAHAGNSPDWFYGELDIPSMLIELRPANADFNPDPINILPNAEENFAGILCYIERVLEPVSFWHQGQPIYPSQHEIELSLVSINIGETIDPNSLTLYSRIETDNSFKPTTMLQGNPGHYSANLPPLPCSNTLEYYFQATTTEGSTYTYPEDGELSPYTAQSEDLVTSTLDDLELNSGWIVGSDTDSATAGIWTRMNPEGTVAQPEDDHTPSGTMCWVTDGFAGADQDDRDVDGGTTTLTSPRFNALDIGGEPVVSFEYWHISIPQSINDALTIEFSNDDGNTWHTYGYYSDTGPEWYNIEIQFASFIEPTDQMRVRFIAEDAGDDNTVEVAIDDFQIQFLGCPTANPADLNNDGVLNFFDISAFLNAFAAQNPIADFTKDGIFDFFDVSAFIRAFLHG